MSTRAILLDDAFITALADTESVAHQPAVATYRSLIDGYTARADRLFALSDTLGSLPGDVRRGLLAPVQTLWVSRQHRSAAKRVDEAVSEHTALTLVLLSREKIRAVATVVDVDGGTLYDDFDLDVIGVDVYVDAASQDEATSITSVDGATPVDTANAG